MNNQNTKMVVDISDSGVNYRTVTIDNGIIPETMTNMLKNRLNTTFSGINNDIPVTFDVVHNEVSKKMYLNVINHLPLNFQQTRLLVN